MTTVMRFFGGRSFRGLSLLALVLALAGTHPRSVAQDAAKPAAPLPSPKEIIDRFIKELGGREAYKKIQSQRVKGTYDMPAQGIKGTLDVIAARPSLMRVRVNLPGFGDVLSGYDGKIGWSVNAATGPMLLEGKQLEQLKEQADFDSILHDESLYSSMETVEKTEFDGRECYKVKLVRKTGTESTEYYEVKTGLLAGLQATQESSVGPIAVTSTLTDYKKFGPILFATKTTQNMGAFSQVIAVHDIQFVNVPASEFAPPESIQALLKPAPAASAPSGTK